VEVGLFLAALVEMLVLVVQAVAAMQIQLGILLKEELLTRVEVVVGLVLATQELLLVAQAAQES
jgi:hypothetical protein